MSLPHSDQGAGGARLTSASWRGVAMICALLLMELALLVLFFQLRDNFECRDVASPQLCDFLSDSALRAVAGAGALTIALLARPAAARLLLTHLRPRLSGLWLAAHIAGFLLVLAQSAFLTPRLSPQGFTMVAAAMMTGAVVALFGAALAAAPARVWCATAARLGVAAWLGVGVVLTLPELLRHGLRGAADDLWRVDALAHATLNAVHGLLLAAGQTVSRPEIGADGAVSAFVLQLRDFAVEVGGPCSGVEGFALIAAFVGFYLLLFRRELRFPHAMILIPLAIAASWAFNIVRIAALMAIGAYVSPELAVNGFHSHAGWLMFTLLALAVIAASRYAPWIRADRGAAIPAPTRSPALAPPFWRDPAAARIFPFIVFMASALAASTFLTQPALAYPLRALATAAALIGFAHVLRALPWRVDPLAIICGAAVGAAWIATAPGGDAGDAALSAALAQLPGWAFALWAASRLIGTALLVPLVEELFFRGYVLARLDVGGLPMRIVALAVSAGLFAALHDRWLAAGLAGLVFGLLALRRRDGLVDAVLAHGLANALIAAWALRSGDWSLI